MSASPKRVLAAAVLGALVAAGAPARAGRKMEHPVTTTVMNGHDVTSGSMGSARNTSDTVQYIGCSLDGEGRETPIGMCFAETSAGVFRSCVTTGKVHIALIAGMDSDSLIRFHAELGGDGSCTYLDIRSGSLYAPKKP